MSDEPGFMGERVGQIDLGLGHSLTYHQWAPDRELNPQYDGIPDIERVGATIYHHKPDGTPCVGGITFDLPNLPAGFLARPRWQVISWEPLHIEPSVLCKVEGCGDHGWIRDGRWVPA